MPRDCARNAAVACLSFVGGARASEAEHCRGGEGCVYGGLVRSSKTHKAAEGLPAT